jgi:hypothetical protein
MKPPRHALPGGFLGTAVLYVKAGWRATPERLRRSVRDQGSLNNTGRYVSTGSAGSRRLQAGIT